jgi:hypothetical protein
MEGRQTVTPDNSRRRKIALLGAYDRFNYGDLLFPIIVGNDLKRNHAELAISIHALVESDLTQYGALATQSLRALYKKDGLQAGDVVVFAGGGIIGVDWTYMLKNLVGRTANKALYYAQRLVGLGPVDQVCRFYFGAMAPFPWVAGPEDFPQPVMVAYNAVGGSEFATLSPLVQQKTLERLSKAAFLSVRDAETQRLLSPVQNKVPVHLAPDSAILMSEQFPLSTLEALAGAEVLQQTSGAPYICFQANFDYALRFENQIINALEAIYQSHGLRAVLLPIGRYVGLDDQFALRKILERLKTPATMVSAQANIWEIMLTIARANLFLGTSLHGNVTSQSFAVPHLGLSERPCKLDYYLATWDLPAQSRCIRLDESVDMAGKALAIPTASRLEKRAELLGLSHGNFQKLADACGI